MLVVFAILTFFAIAKFHNNYEVLSRNAKCVWLFKTFMFLLTAGVIITYLWPQYKSPVLLCSALPLAGYYLFNMRRIYILVFLAGLFANQATITINGYMPLSKEMIVKMNGYPLPINKDSKVIIRQRTTYKYINDKTIWPFFGDIFYFPYAASVFSIGDCLLNLAILIFLLTDVNKKRDKDPQ